MTAVTMLRMTRAAWYKHRVSVVGIPAVFLLAALALFADGAVQRHWLSVRRLNGCLVANATTGGSWCVSSAAWASFSSPGQTPNISERQLSRSAGAHPLAGRPAPPPTPCRPGSRRPGGSGSVACRR